MFNKKYKEIIAKLTFANNSLQDNVSSLNLIIKQLNDKIKSKDDEIKLLHKDYDSIIYDKRKQIAELELLLEDKRAEYNIQQLGFEDIKESAYYKNELMQIKSKQKAMLSNNTYYQITAPWYVNGNKKDGDKLIKFLTKIAITSFNLNVNSKFDKVNISNQAKTLSRLRKIFDSYNNELTKYGVRLSNDYFSLISSELQIKVKEYIAIENEKEIERERKEILKEQLRVEAEIKQRKIKLEKKKIYLLSQMDSGVDVKDELNLLQKQLDDDNYMMINSRAGYVYIISNPSFGKDVYKIGITRRVGSEYSEPCAERLSELSIGNVPFVFKPNCIMWTNDVFKLESDLHKEFSAYRVNKVKAHREFFKLPLSQIESVVKVKYYPSAVFNYDIIDDDFIGSGYKLGENFKEVDK